MPNNPGGFQGGFQWEKYEAWRKHPLLQFQWRNTLPGFWIGLGAFAAYVAYDKATNDGKSGHH
jgi:NADH dehydrogenase (ubiquinone) 1 beta subcomplex subunit 3